MNKQKQAFTLVELIVVITILAILGTIAFISLQGYSSNSRDSVRISDVGNMKTSLELFHLNAGKYPLPDNGNEVSYSGELLWTQGKFGEQVIKNLSRNLNKVPKDPLTDKEYIYSVSNTQNEYQILSLLENDDFALTKILNQTNAEGTLKVIAKLDGEYNGVFVKSSNYIIPSPSIINAEVKDNNMTLNSANILSQVLNKGENIPEYGNVISKTGALNMNLSVYTGSITKKSTDAEKLNVIQAIKNAYTGSSLTSDLKINKILTTTDNNELIALTETIVLKKLSSSNSGGEQNEEQKMQIVMTSCPNGWNDLGLFGGKLGLGSITTNLFGVDQNYKVCEGSNLTSSSQVVMILCPNGWSILGTFGGKFGIGSPITTNLSGVAKNYNVCEGSNLVSSSQIVMTSCPIGWNDLGLFGLKNGLTSITTNLSGVAQNYKVCEKQ